MNDTSSLWRTPAGMPVLGEGEVHVWRADTRLDCGRIAELRQVLSEDEADRALRYRYSRHRDQFIAARGALRVILSQYLGTGPAGITFSYGPFGKPVLSGGPAGIDIRFNLSHSGSTALCAAVLGREVGVDLEEIRPVPDMLNIAERFFSPDEGTALKDLPEGARLPAFFACWTRKEAYLKAKGAGLTVRLDQFDVPVSPDEPAALIRVAGQPDEPGRWSMFDLDAGAGHAAALAVEGAPPRVACYRWAGPG